MASVTRKSQKSRARRRDEIRAKLLEVIEQLLADGASFTEISIERLVSEANISRSTFYVYFEDKGDLLRGWFRDINSIITDAAQDWWSIDKDATWERLRAAQGRIFEAYRPHVPLMEATNDTAAYDPVVREALEAEMQRNVAGLRKHIRIGQQEGFIDPGLQPHETAEWLARMAERGLHKLVRGASDEEFERLIDAYTDIIWNTLYAPALGPKSTKAGGRRARNARTGRNGKQTG